MSLVTLAGTVSAADLNTNFQDKVANLVAQAADDSKFHQVNIETLDLTSATTNGLNVQDFTCTDDWELWVVGLSVWNPDATSRTITMTLTQVDGVTKYLLDQTVSVSIAATSATEFNATRGDYRTSSPKIFLVKGITYRLTLTSSSASAVDRAYGFLCLRPRRRRA